MTKYFFKEDENTVVVNFAIDLMLRDNNNIAVYKTGKAMYELSEKGRDEDQLKLLHRSRILRVYALLKGEHGNESLLWGLAEEKNNPEKRFHWFTDLRADVSVLVD